MRRRNKDRIPRKRSARWVVAALVILVAVVLYRTGALPDDARDDGLTSTNDTACAELIDRPWLTLPEPDSLRAGHVRAVRVIDGDTLKVMLDGEEVSVRLIGINTPEVGRHHVDPQGRGWRATMYVFDLLQDDPQVRLEFDREREDKYGRTLAYVYLPDGRMLNRLLLEEGRAETMRIPPNTRYAEEFAAITR